MKMYECKCNNCNSQLEVDLDRLQLFCPYCGNKLLIESKNVTQYLTEKEKTKRQKDSIQYKANLVQMHNELEKEKLVWRKKVLRVVIAVGLILVIICASCINRVVERRKEIEKEKTLAVLPYSSESVYGVSYIEVKEKLTNAGFEDVSLRIMTSEDLPETNLSDGQVYKMTLNGHDAYEPFEKYSKLNSSFVLYFYSSDGFLKMPFSSESVHGQYYEEVVAVLQKYGYSNIQLREQAGLIDAFLYQNGQIKSVTIDGEEVFTEKDRYKPDVPIVILYFYDSFL